MPEASKELANLARIGKLAPEPGTAGEVAGLLASGSERLADARNPALALSSRFDLAYNAAHAFSLAALLRNLIEAAESVRRAVAALPVLL